MRMTLNAGVTIKLTLLAAVVVWIPSARPQSYGYSYLRISVKGQPVTNFVESKDHQGWVQLEDVQAQMRTSTTTPRTSRNAGARWTAVPDAVRSSRGPGKLSFGAGDDGNLELLVDAEKHKTLIPEAELDVYDIGTTKFLGRFKLKGIHILSVEDVPASACPMDGVTASFQSIAEEKPQGAPKGAD